MKLPNAQDLYPVIEATWPPLAQTRVGVWTIRQGGGAGSRVSAATLFASVASEADVDQAEKAMTSLGQEPLFMVRVGDGGLDDVLHGLGYEVKDPVTLYAARISDLSPLEPPPVTCFEIWPPLAAQAEIWAKGDIGPARLQVMDRAARPKTSIFGRVDDRPAATAFVAMDGKVAMLHALETLSEHRRKGLARHVMMAALIWARSNRADVFTLLVTRANTAANALYASMGFEPVGHYHYRIKRQPK